MTRAKRDPVQPRQDDAPTELPSLPPPRAPSVSISAEVRHELQLEGLRSVVSGGLLALASGQQRAEALLERIATALELQNKLLEHRTNGHGDAHAVAQGDST